MPDKPLLVVVAGPPASGKTSFTSVLTRATHLPVVAKDAIKEDLMDHVGDASGTGDAAFAVQFSIARELLRAGHGLILEGAFFRTQREIAELAEHARTLVVELHCRIDVLERRYVDRIGERHPGHRGLDALPDLRERVANDRYGVPPIDCPILRIDTSDGIDPPKTRVVEWVRTEGSPGPSGRARERSPATGEKIRQRRRRAQAR